MAGQGSLASPGKGISSHDTGSITGILWRGKFYIILSFALLVVLAFGTYFFLDARQLSGSLAQKTSDYNSLNDVYNKLSGDHTALINSNNDLISKYNDVTDRYNKLSVSNADLQNSYNSLNSNYTGLRSSYDGLNGTVTRVQETSGAVVALHYDFYQSGPSNNRRNYLEATVYNVGNKKADKITIKGRTINADNSTSVNEQTFTGVDPLDKRHVKWDYSTSVSLDSVWYET